MKSPTGKKPMHFPITRLLPLAPHIFYHLFIDSPLNTIKRVLSFPLMQVLIMLVRVGIEKRTEIRA